MDSDFKKIPDRHQNLVTSARQNLVKICSVFVMF